MIAERDNGKDLQMLTANRDASLLTTSFNNVVDEAGERGDTADEESRNSTPVAGELGRIAVHAMEVVHVWYGDVSTSDDIVTVANHVSGLDVVCGGMCKGLTQS
jgi:hypothetical protein